MHACSSFSQQQDIGFNGNPLSYMSDTKTCFQHTHTHTHRSQQITLLRERDYGELSRRNSSFHACPVSPPLTRQPPQTRKAIIRGINTSMIVPNVQNTPNSLLIWEFRLPRCRKMIQDAVILLMRKSQGRRQRVAFSSLCKNQVILHNKTNDRP